ncbi:MAG: hypothetical protein ACHQ4H_14700, partial [Ktedonobacterales bacterium]
MKVTTAMQTHPFACECRGGSLLVSETRVVRRGAPAWAVWRAQVIGASCAPEADNATLLLRLRDGRRFAIEDAAPRDALRLIELLGYDTETPSVPWCLPLEIGDAADNLRVTRDAVTVTHDSQQLVRLAREQIVGVQVTAGEHDATVQIVGRHGERVAIEGVPFGPALDLLLVLGGV